MRARDIILLTSVLVLAAACGDAKPKAEEGADAPSSTAPAFEGRTAKQVLAALPEADRAMFEAPDRMTLYALHPYPVENGKLSPQKDRLEKWGILGQADITDSADRKKLIEAVYRGLLAEDAGPASCFNPRHAISFSKGDRRVNLVICFECTWIHVYGGRGAKNANKLLFSQSVSPVFDALFKKNSLEKHGS